MRPTSAVPSTINVLLVTLSRPIWSIWVGVKCSKGNLSFISSQILSEGRERANYHGEQVVSPPKRPGSLLRKRDAGRVVGLVGIRTRFL